ncbi:hypothetical protein JTF06_12025 [Desemzia sp. RIT804]|uniref:hypothetical protein n=1 Tax=Desemzia sp. RIT 804 TaxID=2810209 RepID=UPI00194F8F73|nr:hypothetical protein [Desemzia sp. RIT 804]MBM6615613.1 hypothetical protein [Desemzia sp. RIT 804]
MTNTNKPKQPEQEDNTMRMFIQALIDIGKQNAKIEHNEENEVKTYRGGSNPND